MRDPDRPSDTTSHDPAELAQARDRIRLLEEVVADYAARYGLTDRARRVMAGDGAGRAPEPDQ